MQQAQIQISDWAGTVFPNSPLYPQDTTNWVSVWSAACGLIAIGIILLIILVLKSKVQAFLALILCTIVVGVVGGMPLTNTTIDGKTIGIVNSVTSGFGGTLGSIGIIIGFGVMMGQIFEATGAAKRMAYTFLKLFGKGREEMALAVSKEAGFTKNLTLIRAIQRDDVVTKDTQSYLNIKLTAPAEQPIVYVRSAADVTPVSVEPTTPVYNPEEPTTGNEGQTE